MYDFLVVGAGLSGATVAERLANALGKKVLVVDKRKHIAGNAFDAYNEHGILIHLYGPHIFHTNIKRVWDYLSSFTRWRYYQHRVLAYVDGLKVPIPINLDTINTLFGKSLSTEEVEGFLEKIRERRAEIKNSEDVVVSKVGRLLYEKFFKNYTKKQWDLFPHELSPEVTSRVPIRTNRDPRYFTDRYQGVPKEGYTKMVERMLSSPNIHILLGVDYREVVDCIKFRKMIYTGPIDYFFDYTYGRLPYRSLRFEFETLDVEYYQEVAVVNYPNDYDFTRITEFKHITGQKHEKTTIAREYPQAEGEPYYPVPAPENEEVANKYRQEARKLKTVYFTGRLAEYRYLNMDVAVDHALSLFERIAREEEED